MKAMRILAIALSVGAGTAYGLQVENGAGAGGVGWASGGVGAEERGELDKIAEGYNLKLVFGTTGKAAFLAGVDVSIAEAGGHEVLHATSDGPWFLAKLPAGSYHVAVSTLGSTQQKTVKVDGRGRTQAAFYWTSP